MGTIHAKAVIERAGVIQYDKTHIQYPWADMLTWLNDAQREIVLIKPAANPKNESVQLVAGSKQSIPSTGIQFMRLTRNMGDDGVTAGRVITEVDPDDMDYNHDWHTATAATTVLHFIRSVNDPKHFYVYPPIPASPDVQAEIVYSAAPDDVSVSDWDTSTDAITLDDIYSNAILDYMLYRAYSQKSKQKGNETLAVSHYQAFQQSLGMKNQAEARAVARERRAIPGA